MLTRLLALAGALAACSATPPSPSGVLLQTVPGEPYTVRLLLDREQAFRLSRAGVMDPSSPSGLTDRFRYRAAVESFTADVLKAYGLCAKGFGTLDIAPAPKPFDTVITAVCLTP